MNFIRVRSATLDFYRKGQVEERNQAGNIIRLDPALDRLIPRGAQIEKLAGGFQFVEGPVWHPDGSSLQRPQREHDLPVVAGGLVTVFRSKSGYTGFDIGDYHQPGSNGLTLDRNGLIIINEHGNLPRDQTGTDREDHGPRRTVRREASQQPE